MQDITHILSDLTEIGGQPMTTSLKVAQRFGKAHHRVLRAIRDLIKAAPQEFTDANFGASSFEDSTGRTLPMYRMTKNGFAMLAMGFTGSAAMAFKVAYIGAFDAMAEQIAAASRVPSIPADLYAQALTAEKAEALSFRAASDAAKIMRARRDVKPLLVQQVTLMREAVQLCLTLGLTQLPDVE